MNLLRMALSPTLVNESLIKLQNWFNLSDAAVEEALYDSSVHARDGICCDFAGKMHLINGKSTGRAGEMALASVLSGQFEHPQQNGRTSFSFVTYSGLP